MVCLSPSSLSTYRQCPRKFYGQSITKEIKWVARKANTRGIDTHTLMESCIASGMDSEKQSRFDDNVHVSYVKECVDRLTRIKSAGFVLEIEKELAVTKTCKPCDFWDGEAALRCKADVLLTRPRTDYSDIAFVADIKTGRVWDKDSFQLRLEALLIHIIYDTPLVEYAYLYIDEGYTIGEKIDFDRGLSDVQDVLDTIGECRSAIKNNYFPPVANKFCKWCQWNKTKECGL